MEWTSAAAAVLSVGVAVWGAVLTRRQTQLDRRLVEIEQARENRTRADRRSAELRARVAGAGTGTSLTHYLTLENAGEVQARHVHVELGDVAIEEHAALIGGPDQDFKLPAGQGVSYRFAISQKDPLKQTLRVTWGDDAGGGEKKEIPVQFHR